MSEKECAIYVVDSGNKSFPTVSRPTEFKRDTVYGTILAGALGGSTTEIDRVVSNF